MYIIGQRIHKVRKTKGLTQAAFAKKILCGRTLVGKLEKGSVNLSPLIRLAICNVFGVRNEWLLTGQGEIFDNQWGLLEARARELGEDIYLELSMLMTYKTTYQELLEVKSHPDNTGWEKNYINKLIIILRQKDENVVSAITQNIDTFLTLPDKKKPSGNNT
jgi:transcriptional regulator with XRE-family HTH domain